MGNGKPIKKTDSQLWKLINEKISHGQYIFLPHAEKRLKDRKVNDLDVLNVLENKLGYKRKRNKKKDKYEEKYQDWSYCIEGADLDKNKIRIVISFDENLLLIVTIIRLD